MQTVELVRDKVECIVSASLPGEERVFWPFYDVQFYIRDDKEAISSTGNYEIIPKNEKKAFLELENKITYEDLQLMLTDQEKTKKLQKSQIQITKMNKDLIFIKEIWDFRANAAYHLAFHDELFNTRLKKVMT